MRGYLCFCRDLNCSLYREPHTRVDVPTCGEIDRVLVLAHGERKSTCDVFVWEGVCISHTPEALASLRIF